MNALEKKCLKFFNILKLVFVVLLFLPTFAFTEEPYVFERMWPNLQQNWYFLPRDVAVDSKGFVYILDEYVKKFNPDGLFITKWSSDIWWDPSGIALNQSGNVFVVDTRNSIIQIFSSDGQPVANWGAKGSGNGQFDGPKGIDIDDEGNVYVTDSNNHRVQKLDASGKFISAWGSYGSGDGNFDYPTGIAVGTNGYVYVIDCNNNRVQKFSTDGQFIGKWGTYGSGKGEFNFYPYQDWHEGKVAVDAKGDVYVTDLGNHRVQKFSSSGQFIADWGTSGVEDGNFEQPVGIAIDHNQHVYVADYNNFRIQKFDTDGQFLTKWGSTGSGNDQFNWPQGITTDNAGNVYVADRGNRCIKKFSPDGYFISSWHSDDYAESGGFVCLQKMDSDGKGSIYALDECQNSVLRFSIDGQLLAKWGTYGTGSGEFDHPTGVAADQNGYVFVVDYYNNRIQKFTSNGDFVTQWGEKGSGNGEFDFVSVISPPFGTGIAAAANGYVYVADCTNNRIQKFTSEGDFVAKWGTQGEGDGEFRDVRGVAVDQSGNVYATDDNNCVQKFTSNGEFLTRFGKYGYDAGQMHRPFDLSISPNGKVYVADTENHRIQVFSNGEPVSLSGPSKAIIVAGGGPKTEKNPNNLWEATTTCTNSAYSALTYQGYTKDNIYYLSADTDLDFDGNGKADDVDADATNANLEYAIKTWAKDADNLLLYMIDHGGIGTFRMRSTENLYAETLDTWLDSLQQTLPGTVTIVYDACESGSFLPYLMPPAGKKRILVTSTSAGEVSTFVSDGTLSFSFLFWAHMFNGSSFYESFVNAKNSISMTYSQIPQLDGNGNGIGNEKEDKDVANLTKIGNETKSAGDVPVIGGVSPVQALAGATSATLYAEQVIDADGISRVWAVITPPGYSSGSTDTPVTDLPTIDLNSVGDNRYEAAYTNFTSSGIYNIAIFAMDRKGVLSLPVQTSVTTTSSCLSVGAGLSIQVPCAEYSGNRYGFLLDFYRHPDDPSGYYWKIVMATLTTGADGDCLSIGTDLSMPIECVSYNGTQYGFTLRFYNNTYDPSGLYWKMDMSTLAVK